MSPETLFIPPLSEWPADLRDQYYERVCLMEFDGGIPPLEAEKLALADTWRKR